MRYRFDSNHRVVCDEQRLRGRRRPAAVFVLAAVWLVAIVAPSAPAQEPGLPPELDPNAFEAGPPVCHNGGVSFFSQELGSVLRLRYNTESYGQDDHGNFDVGTMRVVNLNNAVAFFDGQVTLNDVQGVGYNVGVGYRWLDRGPWERVIGLSVWADGTSTEAGNFFPQVGVSYESLGDFWDFRANGYIPLGEQDKTGAFEPTGEIDFLGNTIAELTNATVDSSFSAAELELARRLGPERDAWLFGGGYVLANDDQDTGGYRVGLRGYAYPDLLVQFAVTDDEIFHTNATFSLTWFVGRTRSDYRPTCGVPDRLREPVMRNDYVVLAHSTAVGGIPLTDVDGAVIEVVHVNSAAPDGGDGTYENPLNNLDLIDDNSNEGAIVLAWAESQFIGQQAVLQDDQRFLGEGDDFVHTVFTSELGTLVIPETSPGARSGNRPVIMDSGGDAITLADNNEVANFEIDGGTRGIVAGANGAGNPNLHDLAISNLTGNGIDLEPLVRVDPDTGDETIAFNVTIDEVDFDNVAGVDIDIDAGTTVNPDDPGVTLLETISITNVNSDNNGNTSIRLSNTHSGGTVDIDRFVHTSGTNGIEMDNFDAAFTMSNSSLTNAAQDGVRILNDSDGSFTFASSNTFDNIDGTTFLVDGDEDGGGTNDFDGTIEMNADINNNDGSAVVIRNIGEPGVEGLVFNGDIDHSGTDVGILITDNTQGTILFTGDLTLNTTNANAVTLSNNGDTDISFTGELDITTTGAGDGFNASGGGLLTVSSTTNSIETDGGVGLTIDGMEITGLGVAFADVNVSNADHGIVLTSNTGGPITIGATTDEAGDAGTIQNTSDDAIVITDSANVAITGLIVNNTGAFSGVSVTQNTDETMTVDLSDLQVNNGDRGIEVEGGGTGDLNLSVNDTEISSPTDIGFSATNVEAGTIDVNNLVIDGSGTTATAGILIANSDASFNFDDATSIANVPGTAFEVDRGEAAIVMAGEINNTAGRSVHIHDVAGGSVTFTVDSQITDDNEGILVEDNSGGTISFQGTTDLDTATNDAVTVQNNTDTVDIVLDDLDITTTSGDGVVVTGNAGTTSITFNGVDVSSTGGGRGFAASGGGDLTVTGNNNVITTTDGVGLTIDGMNIVSQATFESVSSNGATNGILLNNVTGSTITVGDTNNSVGEGGTIQNTTDAGVSITNTASVVLNGVTVENAGDAAAEEAVFVRHTDANPMSVTFNDLTVTNQSNEGIDIDGSAGSGTFNVAVSDLDLESDGDGFVVNGGATLTATGTNIIETDTGVGLSLTDVAITVADFRSVTVNNGSGNGIVMNTVTGGEVAITGTGVANSGGQLTTTGDAIVLSDVENVDLSFMRIVNAGDQGVNVDHTAAATTAMDVTIDNLTIAAADDEGIHVAADNDANSFAFRLLDSSITDADVVMDVTGAGHFGLLVEGANIATDVGGTDRAFDLQFHDGAVDGDVTIRGNSSFTADDGEALFIDSFDAALKDIKLLVEDSNFTNTTGTDAGADIRSRGNTLFQATVQGNDFTSGAGISDLVIRSNGTASARMRLNLGGEDASDFNSALGANVLEVREEGTSAFSIFERDATITTDARNNDPVNTFPNDAAFQDLATEPELPLVP